MNLRPPPRAIVWSGAAWFATALIAAASLAVACWAATCVAEQRHPAGGPFVFAHRGASGIRPEHTLGAYTLAMEQGADYVEPDLQLTEDGFFICLHDDSLNRTTDVATRPEFVDRSRPDKNGKPQWLPQDFSLAEIKTLRTRQGTTQRPKNHDGEEAIPTFAEMVAVVRRWNHAHGTRVGITPEVREGQAGAFIAFVHDEADGPSGLGTAALPLYVQSFSLDTILEVREEIDAPCMWLVRARPAPDKLALLAGRLDGIAAPKKLLLVPDGADWVRSLKEGGFTVVGWTFADDDFDGERFSSAEGEIRHVLSLGVDAIFTDYPATGVAARDAFRRTAAFE